MSTVLSPTAGYILDVCRGAGPGPISPSEQAKLRGLAEQVAVLAADPSQEEKRRLWYRHNALDPARPMLLIFPEDCWEEILPEDILEVADPFWRQWEWYFRHLLYRHENYPDDFVVEPDLYVTRVMRYKGFGVQPGYVGPGRDKGAWRYDPPLKYPADIEKLSYPEIEYDPEATGERYQVVGEMFSDLLPVHLYSPLPHANLIGEACALRGIDQLMLDLYDRPEWVHRLMGFLAESLTRQVRYLESEGCLSLNNRNHYTDSGGIGYTRELPAADFDGRVRLKDLWGFGVAQEWALVSPQQHTEFLLNYQMRLLRDCGLIAYGCCESYAQKFGMLSTIPRLRRVSVSPWCEIESAAEWLPGKAVFSWKPNPAIVIHSFEPERIRRYLRRTLDAARGCALEIVHKDTFTIHRQPERLIAWTRIAREEIER